MGNSQSQENEEEQEKKSKVREKIPITPYTDGMPVLQSKLQKMIRQTGNGDQGDNNNEVIAMKENKEKISDIQLEVQTLEQSTFPTIYEHIRQEFDMFSYENKMGQGNLLEYFGLQDLQHHQLGMRFFLTSKTTLSQEKTGPFLDYSKFLKTLAMLSGKNQEGRLQFLYQLFDLNLDGKIERDEMRDTLKMILEALLTVSYEDEDLRLLSRKIFAEQERQINLTLDQITADIFEQSNETNSINFTKWREWIESIEGVSEVLSFDPQTCSSQETIPENF